MNLVVPARVEPRPALLERVLILVKRIDAAPRKFLKKACKAERRVTMMVNIEDRLGGCDLSRNKWSIADAKMKLCEVIEKARLAGPQKITKYGRSTAVLISAEEWERIAARNGSLAEFLTNSPFREPQGPRRSRTS